MYYFSLPSYFHTFINDYTNIEQMIPPDRPNYHEWHGSSLKEWITLDGREWFKNIGVNLATAHIFSIAPNSTGPIHADWNDESINTSPEFAFNVVLKGQGEMQWVKVDGTLDNDSYSPTGSSTRSFKRYKDVQNVEIIDSWTGHMAVVNVKEFHRVVTADSRRICLSIRAHMGPLLSFNDVVSRIKSQ